jgi:hypothetical protein
MAKKTRTCTVCGITKPLNAKYFYHTPYVRKDGTRGHVGKCIPCYNRLAKERYEANPQAVLERNRRWEASDHARFMVALSRSRSEAKQKCHAPCSASPEEIEAAFTGSCEMCGKTEDELGKKLHMDHDHVTGKFRGWLCGRCNGGIGFLNEDVDLLKKAIEYLESHCL